MTCRFPQSARGKPEGLEASILWYTEGKGDEDLQVHWFRRWHDAELDRLDLDQPLRFGCDLPPSPLSYEGTLLRVRWCVRVRLFYPDQHEVMYQVPLQLVAHGAPPAAARGGQAAADHLDARGEPRGPVGEPSR